GLIELSTTSTDNEVYRAWQHLNLAEILEGGYTGVAGDAADQADVGVNVPASARSGVGYYMVNGAIGSRNELVIGAFAAGEALINAALSPAEANSIDQKLDD